MRKKRFLQTDFIKFILEKYAQDGDEGQELPDENDEEPKKIKSIKEFDEEEENDEEPTEDDILINELLKEYKRLKKRYESSKIYYRRK